MRLERRDVGWLVVVAAALGVGAAGGVAAGGSSAPAATVTMAAPRPAAPLRFAGSGISTIAPFETQAGRTLVWSLRGASNGFAVYDRGGGAAVVVAAPDGTQGGSTYLDAGPHAFHVVAHGRWTITLR